ncbi:MAG: HAD-IA family hydrolase [Actinomycetia bacterium]|nr:HAD-IA family hydrolase [Actinomycetes bacterium]
MAAWLGLGAGNDFERGQTSTEQFADAFLDQFGLSISSDQFLAEFAAWPSGLLPGAAQLVADLDVVTATLSNTNTIHWQSSFTQDVVVPMFSCHFPSFELGLAKPAEAIFARAVELLDVDPGDVAFVDDNLVNIEAAKRVGLAAFHVRGPAEARSALATLPSLRASLG